MLNLVDPAILLAELLYLEQWGCSKAVWSTFYSLAEDLWVRWEPTPNKAEPPQELLKWLATDPEQEFQVWYRGPLRQYCHPVQ